MFDYLKMPWPWYISGFLVGTIFIVLYKSGKSFGFSSNYRTICSLMGAGKKISFFNFNSKNELWNIVFLIGTVAGAYAALLLGSNNIPPEISDTTLRALRDIGLTKPSALQPEEIFDLNNLQNIRILMILSVGGFLAGFGSRWAGGCTSGHIITGLSRFQPSSLVASAAFFVGGTFASYVIVPFLLGK